MKTFKQYILEADYKRFLKKNKHLSNDQQKEINSFFQKVTQAATEFEKEYGWQSKRIVDLTYDDFKNFMSKYRYYNRKNLKKVKIPGKKGVDYWPIRLKSKDYIANIPLKYETAKYMNTCKYGLIHVDFCIGWPNDQDYWETYVREELKVPIYIVDYMNHKWVVMILPDNKHYEVWDKFNKEDISKTNPEPIPNFSIKKELISGKGKLYDEIREIILTKDDSFEIKKYTENQFIEAVDDYIQLVSEIKNAINTIASNEMNYNGYNNDYKIEIENILENELESINNSLNYEEDYNNKEIKKLKYNKEAIEYVIDKLDDMYISEFDDFLDDIERKFPDFDLLSYIEEPHSYDIIADIVSMPDLDDFTFMFQILSLQGIEIDIKKAQKCIENAIYEISSDNAYDHIWAENSDIYVLLDNCGIPSPEDNLEYDYSY